MALNLQGFVTDPNNFSGLYKTGDDLLRNKQVNEQKAERQQTEQDKLDARKTATSSYLQDYLNPKHFLTGTNYDPVVTSGVSGILQKAMQLASKGVDAPDITNAIAPDVADLSKATEGIKSIQKQMEDSTAMIKDVKGIDRQKYQTEFKKAAFYNPDGSMKDLSTVDPNQNYGDQVLKNADVFNNEGINDFVKNSGHTVNDQVVKTRDSKGRVILSKADITKPNFMVSDTDAQGVHKEFVPKYDVATEGDAALDHAFKDETGNDVKAPVRMVTDDVWNSLPNSAKGYILQETRKLIKDHPDISIGSTQAEHLGKAIAYDELKNNSKDYSTIKRTDVDLRPLPPRVGVNIYNNTQPPTVDLYNGDKNIKGLKQIVDEEAAKGQPFTQLNMVPSLAWPTLQKMGAEASGNKNFNVSSGYIIKEPDGSLTLRAKKTGQSLGVIDASLLNVAGNQQVMKLAGSPAKNAAATKINLGAKQVGKFDDLGK